MTSGSMPPRKSSDQLARTGPTWPSAAPVCADKRTRLAVTRTVVALDRTLMAWVRTSLSLISFGFTIYKFFEYLQQAMKVEDSARVLGPRGVALILIALGVGSLAIATLEYRAEFRKLQEEYKEYGPFHRSLALATAAVVSVLGILGFALVFFE